VGGFGSNVLNRTPRRAASVSAWNAGSAAPAAAGNRCCPAAGKRCYYCCCSPPPAAAAAAAAAAAPAAGKPQGTGKRKKRRQKSAEEDDGAPPPPQLSARASSLAAASAAKLYSDDDAEEVFSAEERPLVFVFGVDMTIADEYVAEVVAGDAARYGDAFRWVLAPVPSRTTEAALEQFRIDEEEVLDAEVGLVVIYDRHKGNMWRKLEPDGGVATVRAALDRHLSIMRGGEEL